MSKSKKNSRLGSSLKMESRFNRSSNGRLLIKLWKHLKKKLGWYAYLIVVVALLVAHFILKVSWSEIGTALEKLR